jgi:hypothetical protein
MDADEPTETTLGQRAVTDPLAASGGLSPEEMTRRLHAAARILATGAIRAAIAARPRREAEPAG